MGGGGGIQLWFARNGLLTRRSHRNLEERERLTERVAYLEMRLQEKDEEMKVSMRRSQLETKSMRAQVVLEHGRVRELQQKLEALAEVSPKTRFRNCEI